jgi:hypothetical protein
VRIVKEVSHSAIRKRIGSLPSRCFSIWAMVMKTRRAVAFSSATEPKLMVSGSTDSISREMALT